MTKENEQKILDELGIEKPTVRCGTYRMPALDPEIIDRLTIKEDTSIGTDDIPLDKPTFYTVQRD